MTVTPRAMTGVGEDTATWQATWSLCRRELVRFVRQRSRIASSLATPLILWVFLGLGLGRSFQPSGNGNGAASGGSGYLAYFFPGSLVLVVLFTAIFSTISIIEDRNVGFLQGVLVAPVSRRAIVLGKVLGGTLIALLQGLLYLMLAPLGGLKLGVWQVLGALPVLFLIAFALTALGFIFAWRMESVAGFHGVMNLILMPLWMLSGAFFPASSAPTWLAWVVRLNPLTYGLALIRDLLEGHCSAGMMVLNIGVTVAFAGLMYAAAAATVRPRAERAR